MTNRQDKINQLLDKLDLLVKRQNDFSKEIYNLRLEINKLKSPEMEQPSEPVELERDSLLLEEEFEPVSEQATAEFEPPEVQLKAESPKQIIPPVDQPAKEKSDLEKFIGENLINKIGIVIIVIGVSIGAKYAIDHQLISPLTRIILGYLVGLGLMGFAMKLKTKYENFSAVLLSGAMAIMYFITYSAYSFYDLFPQEVAFGLMVVFTVFTVVAAINYDRQVIAHIGLVGAYAVPFLLSDGSGKVATLFSYMAIINVGILVIAFKKYWKKLYYAAFVLTWSMYLVWYVTSYQTGEHFYLALTFLAIFFTTFYLIFLAYKLSQKVKFRLGDISLLLLNSFIFYGIGYGIIDSHETGKQLLGLFTLGNAIIHFVVSMVIYRQQLADKNLFYLVIGLVLVFITIAIPVQLDGNWVTLLWAGEAALLFWVGRTKQVSFYEQLAYVLMVVAFFSILQDWTTLYYHYNPEIPATRLTPLLNANFLTSLLFITAFGFINWLHRNQKYASPWPSSNILSRIISVMLPAILLFSLYAAFRVEIDNYWTQLYADSRLTISSEDQSFPNEYSNADLNRFKVIWIVNYSLLFVSLLAFVNIRKIKNQQLGFINLGLIVLTLLAFLVGGLYAFSELRESYLNQELAQYYQRGAFNIGIRYVSFAFVALALLACYQYLRQDFMRQDLSVPFDVLLHLTVIWIASSEMISWMDIAESAQSYKFGLSILWGVYSLFLITLGIWKRKKHLRVGAIVLFGLTLIKLFFYDIAELDTIAKTVVFVSLGVLLLIISFLYNKYKDII